MCSDTLLRSYRAAVSLAATPVWITSDLINTASEQGGCPYCNRDSPRGRDPVVQTSPSSAAGALPRQHGLTVAELRWPGEDSFVQAGRSTRGRSGVHLAGVAVPVGCRVRRRWHQLLDLL